jgi:polar amino acid transport system permease protein
MSEDLVVVPLRHWGRWVAAAISIGVALAFVSTLATNDHIEWGAVGTYFFSDSILGGLAVTIELTILSMVIGVLVGVASAVAGLSPNPVLRFLNRSYTWFFRGTPLLVQIIFWFNLALIVPEIGIGPLTADANQLITPFIAALLALSLNEGAYMSEIVRAGIQSVDQGQTDAAHALGLTRGPTMRHIVLPQAMRVIIPPTGNETISMLKSTSLVAVIAAQDLLTRAQLIYSRSFQVIELLIVASLWYLVLTTVASVGQHYLERRFRRGFATTGTPPQSTLWGRVRGNLVPRTRTVIR